MARLREGRANTARGAAHFLRETVLLRRGQRATTMRADSGFYAHRRRLPPDGCPFSITIRRTKAWTISSRRTRRCLDADSLLDGRCRRWAETTYTPFQAEADAAPVRLTSGGEAHARFPARPLCHLQLSRLHHRPGRGDANWRLITAATPRRNATGPQVASRHLAPPTMAPSRDGPQPDWTFRIGLGERIVTTKTLRRRVFALAGRIIGAPPDPASSTGLWEEKFSRALARLRAIPLPA